LGPSEMDQKEKRKSEKHYQARHDRNVRELNRESLLFG
jgi:hypothetical protein